MSQPHYRRAAVAGFVVILVLTGAVLLGGALRSGAAPAEKPAAAHEEGKGLRLNEDDARRAGLVVKRIEPTESAETVALFGTVAVNKDKLARVLAPVSGRLVKVTANLGDSVGSGDALAWLQSPESGEARSSFAQAQSELTLAEANFTRIRGLVAFGSLARKDELKARADVDKARAALTAAAGKLKALGVEPAAAGSSGTLALTAPFAGSVVEKNAVPGEQAQAYQALFSIGDLSTVWIEADLYERDLGRIAVGADAAIGVAAFPGKSFAGKVTYVSSMLDRETRTAKARIEVANPDGVLKPGMFATVAASLPATHTALEVPEQALVLVQGQMTAFVRDGEGRDGGGFEPRPVETGARRGGQITITSGLEPGDEVVVAGAYALKARLLKSQIGDAD